VENGVLIFQKPFYLLFLLLLPVFIVFRRIGILRTVSIALPLCSWNGAPPERHTWIYLLHRISQTALAAAFIGIIAAIAEPVLQTTESMYAGTGQALMFVIDSSPSMAAQDIGMQTRFDAAKHIIRQFVERYQGDSFGLTAVGSTAAVLIPPTIDRQTFLNRLDRLQIGEFGDGTALGMGLASAVLHLTQYVTVPSHIILFTDGDNNTGEIHPRTAADIIKHKKIGFSIIGMGRSGYAPVKYFDPIQKKEISGTLRTVLNETGLQQIARYGNGRYYSAQSPELASDILGRLMEKIPAAAPLLTVQKTRHLDGAFAAAALIVFGAAWIIRRIGMQTIL